jgi:Lrp/AsnC family transcriptional regulator for asnA, asnC and gidA
MVNDFNTRLIAELSQDARQSSAELARKLNVSETTVRRRIERLEKDGIVKFKITVDPAKLGYNITAIVAIEVELGKIDGVSDALASHPNVRYVCLCTGNHDIFVGAWFRSSMELTDFIKNYLAKIHGLRKSETFIILDVKKDEVGWPGAVK